MTPLCGTCALWGDERDVKQRYRKCGAIKHGRESWEDDNTIISFETDEPIPPPATAYTQDGSGYYAALKTRDDFGCTLHTPTKE